MCPLHACPRRVAVDRRDVSGNGVRCTEILKVCPDAAKRLGSARFREPRSLGYAEQPEGGSALGRSLAAPGVITVNAHRMIDHPFETGI